jgi:DNA-directed RNA polymerase subunit L
MATEIVNFKNSKSGFECSFELKNVPVSFVNGLRRILIGRIPAVVIRDVQVLENTTQLPHEMLKHRMEMLPVSVNPGDATTIKDAKIEIRILPEMEKPEARIITTDDFVIESSHPDILMRDRDINQPLLFVKVRKGESLHMRGKLAVEFEQVSQVCTATTSWHIDAEMAKIARKEIEERGGDVRTFDNILIQRYYSRGENGRPNWFDLSIESVGVLPAKEILKIGISVLRKQVSDYQKEAMVNVQKESDENTYNVTLDQGGHTIGYLMQEIIYGDKNVNFVSYDVLHPLKNTMILRFNTTKSPESILNNAFGAVEEYCAIVEKGL